MKILCQFCQCGSSLPSQWWCNIKRLDKFSNPLSKVSALLLCNMLTMPSVQTHFQSHPSPQRGNRCTNALSQPCDVIWPDCNCSHKLVGHWGDTLNRPGENFLAQNSVWVVKSKYKTPETEQFHRDGLAVWQKHTHTHTVTRRESGDPAD